MGRDILVELNDKIDAMNEAIDKINVFFENVGNFFYTVSHPIIIWNWCMSRVPFIATALCIVCLIYYAVTRQQKPLTVLRLTIITFILLKIVDMAI